MTPEQQNNIPQEWKDLSQWLLWRNEPDENGKISKRPRQVNGELAATNKRRTWTDCTTALFTYLALLSKPNAYDGLGFVIRSPYVFFDFDGCRNPETGRLSLGFGASLDF